MDGDCRIEISLTLLSQVILYSALKIVNEQIPQSIDKNDCIVIKENTFLHEI